MITKSRSSLPTHTREYQCHVLHSRQGIQYGLLSLAEKKKENSPGTAHSAIEMEHFLQLHHFLPTTCTKGPFQCTEQPTEVLSPVGDEGLNTSNTCLALCKVMLPDKTANQFLERLYKTHYLTLVNLNTSFFFFFLLA